MTIFGEKAGRVVAALLVGLMAASAVAARHDPIAAAIVGLVAAVEDDVARTDTPLLAIKTKGCFSRVETQGHVITVDWTRADMVSPGDTFLFISAPPAKFAIVADVSKPDQKAKLRALFAALQDQWWKCNTRKAIAP